MIDVLYQDALGRAAAPADEAAFAQYLASGHTRRQAAEVVFGSPEYRDHLVQTLYHNLLGRNAEPDGQKYWADRLATHDVDDVIAEIVSHDEFFTRIAS